MEVMVVDLVVMVEDLEEDLKEDLVEDLEEDLVKDLEEDLVVMAGEVMVVLVVMDMERAKVRLKINIK